jgi:diketogulonate reductase-like aldo/keto reductase
MRCLTRAEFLRLGAAAAGAAVLEPILGTTGGAMAALEKVRTRSIPKTSEQLPVVGLGTWQGFDVGKDPAARAEREEVLRLLFDAGASLIDSSPMYGSSEGVVGDLLAKMKARDKAFLATKVWTWGEEAGIRQMDESFRRFHAEVIDLMQIHNLVDWRTHLPTLRTWKKEGRIRLLGVTHYTESAHGELESVLRAETWDFVQLNYALDDRAVERRLLPLAAERGIAVIVNQPFGGGGLLRKLLGRKLPDWAGEIGCTSWAQLLLKFVLAHPAVTCVIPGTGKPEHMRDNVQAGVGTYPDAALLRRMASEIEV